MRYRKSKIAISLSMIRVVCKMKELFSDISH